VQDIKPSARRTIERLEREAAEVQAKA